MSNSVYTLKNKNGLVIEFVSHGAKLKSVLMPDNKGGMVDVALGYNTVEQINNGDAYIGAICGRVANRIGNGGFTLNGKTYKTPQNDRTNTLHGGPNGLQKKFWNVEPIKYKGFDAFKLSVTSPDGEEGFPGSLKAELIYALTDLNEFIIEMSATTDKPTVINLTSHPYFNLNGVNGGKIFNHHLQIAADAYTPLNALSVPTGEIQNITSTDLDFNTEKRLGDVVNSEYPAIHALGGLDHNWVIRKKAGELGYMAKLFEIESGRSIEVYGTQPGLQVYTAMHFDGSEKGKGDVPFAAYCGVALEAQNFPDAPNKPEFPNSVLNPGETYNETIIYKFGF